MVPLYLLFEISVQLSRLFGTGEISRTPADSRVADPFLYAPAPMLFDLKSGKRRRVVQIVFGGLAFLFFISFVGFGIGSDVTGGIFDAIGLGGSGSGIRPAVRAADRGRAGGARRRSQRPRRLRGPDRRLLRLRPERDHRRRVDGPAHDQHRGAKRTYERAGQAWNDYMATKPNQISVTAAGNAVQVFVLVNDATGASEAQARGRRRSAHRGLLRPARALPLRRRPDQGGRRGRGEGGRRG